MKKSICLLLSLLLIICAGEAALADTDDTLLTTAEMYTGKLSALCENDAFTSLFTPEGEITSLLHEIFGGGRMAPENIEESLVLYLPVKPDTIASLAEQALNLIDEAEVSETAEALLPYAEVLLPRLVGAVPTVTNAAKGATYLAAASIAQLSDVLLLPDVPSGFGVVIERYAGTQDLICCTFTVKESGAAYVTCSLMSLPEDICGILFSEGKELSVEERGALWLFRMATGLTYEKYPHK